MSRLLVFLLILTFSSFSQNHLIDWSANRKLTWDDFQGKPKMNSDNAALTSSNINFQFGYGSSGFRYSITCRFDKNQSWVKVKNEYVLAHEQGHFDIAEIFARKLNKAFKEYQYNSRTVNEDVNKIHDELMKEHHLIQNEYDLETDHSRNKEKQLEWLKKIKTELIELEDFAKYPK